jgi:F-type H+-transporting ATPase subunit epsilon
MADGLLQVDIVSPERVLFSGQATMVITRTFGGGEIAFLAGHAPFLAALTENHTRITLEGGNVLDVAVHGGFVEVSHNKVSILSDVAELGDHIDVNRALAARDRAQERLRQEPTPEVSAALGRAEARLAAARHN